MKKLLLAAALVLGTAFLTTLWAQTKGGSTQTKKELKTMTGKLLKMPWSKSHESYCAGGSDYFVLEVADQRHILQTKSKKIWSSLTQNANKTVTLKGYAEDKRIEPNPMEQAPIGPDGKVATIVCPVFVVQGLE
ncbi:MAG: hypothetical protein EAZ57_06510 [Cytophagales bacterium]|nr:MAG: hypothetical protein EAZ67_07315 [Cytophagales bacterium]TAF60678.1 MAG: hypothetical protein EAZ57_06510 [Cytophagales bacterium]